MQRLKRGETSDNRSIRTTNLGYAAEEVLKNKQQGKIVAKKLKDKVKFQEDLSLECKFLPLAQKKKLPP